MLASLQDALVAKEAPLTLCTWRMEQRERRPLKEQVRDGVEVCLEAGDGGWWQVMAGDSGWWRVWEVEKQ